MKNFVLALAIVTALASSSSGQAQPNKPTGDLSTIVMNAVSGGSAAGMAIELYEISLPLGKYELRFQIADYFRKQGVVVGDLPFLDFVPVRFSISDPAGHYHVPLICTPWAYTTYRGS